MIGMMNNSTLATDNPVEFYCVNRSSNEAGRLMQGLATGPVQKKLSYTGDGRRLVDGQPAVSETPQEMWQRAMLRANCSRAVKEMLGEKRHKGSKLRRLIAQHGGSIKSMLVGHGGERPNKAEPRQKGRE